MTRYREKTRRLLIQYLVDAGPSTVEQVARAFGIEERSIRNYFRHYQEDFQVNGGGKRWQTDSAIRKGRVVKGGSSSH